MPRCLPEKILLDGGHRLDSETRLVAVTKVLAITTGVLLLGLLMSWVLFGLFGHQLVETLYSGESVWLRDRIMSGRAIHSVEDYYRIADEMMRLWTFRAVWVFAALVITLAFVQLRLSDVANHQPGHETEFVTGWLITGVFLVCLIWAILMASVGWNGTLTGAQHGFRQTQTAITSYYLMRGGSFFSYETPVMGYPWSIPFEFPLYQWIVAFAASTFKTPLDQTGRFVSEMFFVLTVLTLWWCLSELNVRPVYRLVFVSLTLVSPEYIFWSRTFLIESTALFFCMSYLLFAFRHARDVKLSNLLLGGISGIVGGLVKATTLPPFVLVAGLFYVYILRARGKAGKAAFRTMFVPFLFFVLLPLFATLLWTRHADQLKSLNVVGVHQTSSAQIEWNFGSLAQRLSPEMWGIFFTRTIPDVVGANLTVVLSLVALLFARHRLFPFLLCMAGFLSHFLIFTNLHNHNYYVYANGLFLIAASACSVIALLEQTRWKHFLGLAIFTAMVLISMKGYYHGYYYAIQKSALLDLHNVVHTIQNSTSAEEIILIFGQNWSPVVPYYSERRALMWADWMPQEMDSQELKEALRRLDGTRIGALFVCNSARLDSRLIEGTTALLKFSVNPKYEDASCSVFTA
jgi:DNA integrity scanning protein DisA with diadenylate cyclase activity